uniref:cytidine deaminase n=1 Tax=Anopheles christyi TaxID=43041 RepID=A0A182JSZ7_9DIPT
MPRPSQFQSQRSDADRLNSTQEVDQNHLITCLVKTILNLSINKSIIKRSDISHIALKGDSRLYNRLMPEVVDALHEIYGYQLIDVEGKGQKAMILCSTLETNTLDELNESYRKKYTFLFIILGYIFMKNGAVPESLMWDFLETIGIEEQQEHRFFGDPKKMFETFVKQAYVTRTKQSVEGMSEESIFLSWGVRANHEVSKRAVLDSICKLMNRKPTDFKTQYIETQGEANNSVKELIEAAIKVRNNAYCPYSNFPVGAALRISTGEIVTGCNVENGTFGPSVCAERTAVCKAISEGHREFTAVAVAAYQENEFTAPCGTCRQTLAEFSAKDIPIYLVKPAPVRVMITSLFKLLPHAFSPTFLNNK